MENNDNIAKLKDLLNKSLSMLEDLDPLAFTKFIDAEKKSFEYVNALPIRENNLQSTKKPAVKRYFVSYFYQHAKGCGYGNTIITANKFDKNEFENDICKRYKYDNCVILNFQKLAKDES